MNISLNINDLGSTATGLSARIDTIPPLPNGPPVWSLEYHLNGPFVDLETHQILTSFPDQESAVTHGLQLYYQHISRVLQHPFFGGRHKVAHVDLGDREADAWMYWEYSDGWSWQIEYWWPGERMQIDSGLHQFDVTRAYVELRHRFMEIVKLMGGSSLDIETCESPFVEDDQAPQLPSVYEHAILMSPEEMTQLRAQVARELEEHQRREAERPHTEEENTTDGQPTDRPDFGGDPDRPVDPDFPD